MDITTLSLAKKYVDETAKGLGAVKGANATIESITRVEGGNNVVYAWTGADGTKQTQAMFVADAKDLTFRNCGTFGNFKVLPSDFRAGSDYAVIKKDGVDYILTFLPAADSLASSAKLYIRSYTNGYFANHTHTRTYNHRFGHCNTVDYAPETDCLILGSGSGDYDLPNKMYIIPNASNALVGVASHGTADFHSFESVNAITIDLSEYDIGKKVNALWGETNISRRDIAYLITDDCGQIHKIQLGMGANDLGSGQFVEGKESTEFNGSFKFIESFAQGGCSYDTCIQGACYYKGKIIANIGHSGLRQWAMTMSNGKIYVEEKCQFQYSAAGTKNTSSSTNGVCIDSKGNMIVHYQGGCLLFEKY